MFGQVIQFYRGYGFIKGDDGKLNPTASISRAEMAVLLHRVLTM